MATRSNRVTTIDLSFRQGGSEGKYGVWYQHGGDDYLVNLPDLSGTLQCNEERAVLLSASQAGADVMLTHCRVSYVYGEEGKGSPCYIWQAFSRGRLLSCATLFWSDYERIVEGCFGDLYLFTELYGPGAMEWAYGRSLSLSAACSLARHVDELSASLPGRDGAGVVFPVRLVCLPGVEDCEDVHMKVGLSLDGQSSHLFDYSWDRAHFEPYRLKHLLESVFFEDKAMFRIQGRPDDKGRERVLLLDIDRYWQVYDRLEDGEDVHLFHNDLVQVSLSEEVEHDMIPIFSGFCHTLQAVCRLYTVFCQIAGAFDEQVEGEDRLQALHSRRLYIPDSRKTVFRQTMTSPMLEGFLRDLERKMTDDERQREEVRRNGCSINQ